MRLSVIKGSLLSHIIGIVSRKLCLPIDSFVALKSIVHQCCVAETIRMCLQRAVSSLALKVILQIGVMIN